MNSTSISTAHGRLGIAWLASAGSAIVLVFYATSYPLNHDVGWWLHLARAMLDGQQLYVDIIEINPPLYSYLAMIPVGLAQTLGITPVTSAKLAVLALCLGAGVWSVLLIRGATGGMLRPVYALGLSLALLGLPGPDFGQRDHLLLPLIAPYLVLLSGRLSGMDAGRVSSAAAGVVAGVGFGMKPHFLLLWAAVELLVLMKARSAYRWSRRPELHAVAITLTAYAIGAAVLHPEYPRLLWNARHLYGQFAVMDYALLSIHPQTLVVLAALAGYITLARRGGEYSQLRALALIFLTVACSAWLVAVVQGKGWRYHFYPALASAVISNVLVLFGLFQTMYRRGTGRTPVVPVVVAAAMVLVLYLVPAWLIGEHRQAARARTAGLVAESRWLERHSIESMVVLSSRMGAFPLVNYSGAEWVSPFPSLWWLQALYADREHAQHGVSAPLATDSVERDFLERFVAAVQEAKPAAVLVDTAGSPHFGGASFPYVTYLSQNPRFEVMWREYREADVLGRYVMYRPATDSIEP